MTLTSKLFTLLYIGLIIVFIAAPLPWLIPILLLIGSPLLFLAVTIVLVSLYSFAPQQWSMIFELFSAIDNQTLFIAKVLTLASLMIHRTAGQETHLGFPTKAITYYGHHKALDAEQSWKTLPDNLLVNLGQVLVNLAFYYIALQAAYYLWEGLGG